MSTRNASSAGARGAIPGDTIPELSAVMPAFNEEAILPIALAEAVAALERQVEAWELVVVDDGSTDRTAAILAERAAREPRLRIITNTTNQGYSRALTRGFLACRYAVVFYTDSDAQFDLLEISRLYAMLDDADMVAGYRARRTDSLFRHAISAAFNLVQSLVLGVSAHDVNCAFKLFRREFFEAVSLSSGGFLIDAELYARAERAGLRWVQAPVTHRPRAGGASTVRVGMIRETLAELWRLRRSL